MATSEVRYIRDATAVVLRQRWCAVLFALLVPAMLLLLFFLPVWLVPGNSIAFQLSLLRPRDYALTIILAPVIALVLTMHAYLFAQTKGAGARIRAACGGAAGGYAGVLGAVFATAACSWCVAALFGFLGTGAILFIIANQMWAILLALALMLCSLHFAAKRVVSACACA